MPPWRVCVWERLNKRTFLTRALSLLSCDLVLMPHAFVLRKTRALARKIQLRIPSYQSDYVRLHPSSLSHTHTQRAVSLHTTSVFLIKLDFRVWSVWFYTSFLMINHTLSHTQLLYKQECALCYSEQKCRNAECFWMQRSVALTPHSPILISHCRRTHHTSDVCVCVTHKKEQ